MSLFVFDWWPHKVQENGFSPVWIRICRWIFEGAFITTAQYGQAYCFGAILMGSSTFICKKYEIFENILSYKILRNAFISKTFPNMEKTIKNKKKSKLI